MITKRFSINEIPLLGKTIKKKPRRDQEQSFMRMTIYIIILAFGVGSPERKKATKHSTIQVTQNNTIIYDSPPSGRLGGNKSPAKVSISCAMRISCLYYHYLKKPLCTIVCCRIVWESARRKKSQCKAYRNRTIRTFSETPPQSCVVKVTSTVLYTLNHSGWWFICSANKAVRDMKAHAWEKSWK